MKSEMTLDSFCHGLIVCNKSRRCLILNWDSEDVAFINTNKKKGVNLVKWQIGLILKTNKQTTLLKRALCYFISSQFWLQIILWQSKEL